MHLIIGPFYHPKLKAKEIKKCLYRDVDDDDKWPVHLLIYSSTHLLIYLSTHLLIYSSTHLLIYSSTHLLIYSSTHLLIYSSTHLLIYSSTHLLIYSSTHLLSEDVPRLGHLAPASKVAGGYTLPFLKGMHGLPILKW
jgi:hypothetical protein